MYLIGCPRLDIWKRVTLNDSKKDTKESETRVPENWVNRDWHWVTISLRKSSSHAEDRLFSLFSYLTHSRMLLPSLLCLSHAYTIFSCSPTCVYPYGFWLYLCDRSHGRPFFRKEVYSFKCVNTSLHTVKI